MLRDSLAYSGFAVKNIDEAKDFYTNTLGLEVEMTGPGLKLHLGGGLTVLVYTKQDHIPAAFTVLNFPVDDIDAAVDDLVAKGVEFIRYPDMPYPQDEKGILRAKAAGYGPDNAWFEDPSGNIFSVQTN